MSYDYKKLKSIENDLIGTKTKKTSTSNSSVPKETVTKPTNNKIKNAEKDLLGKTTPSATQLQKTWTPSVNETFSSAMGQKNMVSDVFGNVSHSDPKIPDNLKSFNQPKSVKQETTPQKKDSFGSWLGKNAIAGLENFNKNITSSLDYLIPTEILGKYDFVSKLSDYYNERYNVRQATAQKSSQSRGKGWEIAGDVISSTVSALPNAILAYMTAGAGTATSAVPTALNAGEKVMSQSTALKTAVDTVIRTTAKNPTYWSSFLQTVGSDYEEAKQNGAGELEATATAMITSLLNAGIEVGSGIEKLPQSLKSGGKSAVREWVKSSIEEGKEEVLQGIVTQGVAKLIYDKDKELFSFSNENAVINPVKSAKEFAMGTVVGGILGGGQVGTQYIKNYKQIQFENAVNSTKEKNISNYFKNAKTANVQLLSLYNSQLTNMQKNNQTETSEYNEVQTKKKDLIGKILANEQLEKNYTSTNADVLKKKFSNANPVVVDMLLDINKKVGEYHSNPNAFNTSDNQEALNEYTKLTTRQHDLINELVYEEITSKYNNIEFTNKNSCYLFSDETAKWFSDTASAFGVKLKFDNTLTVSGLYENGTIVLNPNMTAEDNIYNTFAHELAHHAEHSALYKNLKMDIRRKGVLNSWAQSKGYNDITSCYNTYSEHYKNYYRNVSKQELEHLVHNEVMADYLADLFTRDVNYLSRMARTDTGIKRVYRVVSDYFQRVADRLHIGSYEERFARNVANRFMKALKTADVQKAEKAPARYKLSQNQVVITDEITVEDVKKIQNIANSHPKGYSINEFSSEEISICEKWAKKFWRELGIKSPFFRAWFGDWRVNDKTSIESITLKSDNSFISETVKNKDTGFEISVSKIAKDHIKIHFHNSKFSQYIINNLNEITEKSILLDTCVSEPTGNTKHKNTMVVHNFYVPTEFNGEKIIVKLFVEEFYNNYNGQIQRRDYDLSKVEVFNDTDRFGGSNPTPLYASKNTSMLTISDLFQFVKLYDKNFNPKPASKVVNEDGIPMVMYHGTDYKFTEFDISKGRANMDIQGAFFSPWELDAKGYGKNVGKYYLSIKKPADGPTAFKALNNFKGQNNAGVKAREYLINQGFDGVNFYNEEYVAFYPAQIKSATDNIGTFDKNNSDIRYKIPQSRIWQSSAEYQLENETTYYSDDEFVRDILMDKTVRPTKQDIFHFKYAQQINDKGVSTNKDFARNFDEMGKKSPFVRAMLKNDFERPFNNAKNQYVTRLNAQLNAYHEMCEAYGIKKGSKESQATQWYGEGVKPVEEITFDEALQRQVKGTKLIEYTLSDLKRDFPDTWYKIVAFESYNRKLYDNYLKEVNDMLVRIYPTVETTVKRIEYQYNLLENEMKTEIAKNHGKKDKIAEIQEAYEYMLDELNKLKDNLKVGRRLVPRKNYYRHFNEIKGLMDILNGDYEIPSELAGVSETTRPKSRWASFLQHRKGDMYTADAVKSMLDYIPAVEYKLAFDPLINDFRKKIKAIAINTADDRNANRSIIWLTKWTNDIAGKTNQLDRSIKDAIGRKNFAVLDYLNKRVKSNAILFNMSSAVVQVSGLPNMLAYIKNPQYMVAGGKAYTDYLLGKNLDIYKSTFLKEKFLSGAYRHFNTTKTEKITEVGEKILEFGDKFAAQYIWYTAYEQGKAKNVFNPVEYADDITRRCIGGRGVGEIPLTQKSTIVKLFLPFQIETNNTWNLIKERIKKKDVLGLMMMFGMFHAFNLFFKKIIGRDVFPDIYKDLKEVFSVYSDNDGNFVLDTLSFSFSVVGRIINYTAYGDVVREFLNAVSDDNLEKFLGEGSSRYGMSNIALDAVLKPVFDVVYGNDIDYASAFYSFVTPYGGKQLEKTTKAMKDYGMLPNVKVNTKKGFSVIPSDIPAHYKKDGSVAYLLDNSAKEKAKALLFGLSATEKSNEYYDGESVSYNEKTTAVMRELKEKGISPAVYDTYRKKLSGHKNLNSENAISVLDSMNLTDKEKTLLYSATNSNWKKSYYQAKSDNLIEGMTERLNKIIENGNPGQVTRAKALKKMINGNSHKKQIKSYDETIGRYKDKLYNEDSEVVLKLRGNQYGHALELYKIYNPMIKNIE